MTGFPKQVRQLVVDRAAGFCEICGQASPEQIHHRRPRAKGGTKRPETNHPSNALAVCLHCHDLAESKRDMARDKGWLVPQYATPADVPVQIHGGHWVLLQNSGGVFVPPQGPGRCERCGFHTPSQGHREGCQLFGQGAA